MPNDPFLEEGRIIPTYDGSAWDYHFELFPKEEVKENCFPDEHYVFEKMGDHFHGIAIYADGHCAGYALLYEEWNQWLYLDNLMVSKQYRGNGLGSLLIDACMDLARDLNKLGLWLICQDNNLQAIRFYLKNHFELGGINLPVYEGTKQEGKSDIYLYRRLERKLS